jgi:hypothetical protein
MPARSLARHAKRYMQRRAREKRAVYLENLQAGMVKGPMTKKHEAGLPHEWRKCPVCVIAHIRATNRATRSR